MIDRVGNEVQRELARFGASPGITALVEAWPKLVGPEIARNAWPARLGRDRTLYVHTSSAAWAFELGQLEPRIRGSLGEHAPTRLRFIVGPLPDAVPGSAERTCERVEPSPQHIAAALEVAAQIDDDNLRKVVAKAAALSLANADHGRSSW